MKILPLVLAAAALSACSMPKSDNYNSLAPSSNYNTGEFCCVEAHPSSHKDQQPWANCSYCCGSQSASQCIEGYPPPLRR